MCLLKNRHLEMIEQVYKHIFFHQRFYPNGQSPWLVCDTTTWSIYLCWVGVWWTSQVNNYSFIYFHFCFVFNAYMHEYTCYKETVIYHFSLEISLMIIIQLHILVVFFVVLLLIHNWEGGGNLTLTYTFFSKCHVYQN